MAAMWHLVVAVCADAITSLAPALLNTGHGQAQPGPATLDTAIGEPSLTLEDALPGATERQLRLLGCALCRAAWPFLCDIRSREAVEAAELLADRRCTKAQACRVSGRAGGVSMTGRAQAAMWVATPTRRTARRAIKLLIHGGLVPDAVVAAALRDIFGGPSLRTPVDPFCVTPTVIALAEAAYDLRAGSDGRLDNARLAVLSDALEEAGLADVALLAHLRSHEPHWRGCWGLEAVLAGGRQR
jgi:hypothetical protein